MPNKKPAQLNKKLNSNTTRSPILKQLSLLNKNQNQSNKRLDTVDKRLDKIEKWQNKTNSRLVNIEIDLNEVKKQQQKFIKNQNWMMEKIDWLVGAFQKFDDEYKLIAHQTGNHEERITTIEAKLNVTT